MKKYTLLLLLQPSDFLLLSVLRITRAFDTVYVKLSETNASIPFLTVEGWLVVYLLCLVTVKLVDMTLFGVYICWRKFQSVL